MKVEQAMPDDQLLPAAMRSAMRHLREKDTGRMYTLEDVRTFAGILSTGAEIACYIEHKGYYRPEGCIVYAAREEWLWITTSNGTAESLNVNDYDRTWRLWTQYPDGTERYRQEWDGAEAPHPPQAVPLPR